MAVPGSLTVRLAIRLRSRWRGFAGDTEGDEGVRVWVCEGVGVRVWGCGVEHVGHVG